MSLQDVEDRLTALLDRLDQELEDTEVSKCQIQMKGLDLLLKIRLSGLKVKGPHDEDGLRKELLDRARARAFEGDSDGPQPLPASTAGDPGADRETET